MVDDLEIPGASTTHQTSDEPMKAGTPYGKQVAMFQQ